MMVQAMFLSRARELLVTVSVGRSVRPSVGPSVGRSHFTFFALLSYLKVEKFRYEYFIDINAPAQIITAPAQYNTAPAQHKTAPAQPPATGVVVYTALLPSKTAIFVFRK